MLGLLISYAKSAPPIGAPNATLTPAEIPAAINSRLFISYLNYSRYLNGMKSTNDATAAPMCASGPSRPTIRVPATAKVTPRAFTMNTIGLRYFWLSTPFKKPISSGTPDPAACGAKNTVKTAAMQASVTLYAT